MDEKLSSKNEIHFYQEKNLTKRGFKRYSENPSIFSEDFDVKKKPIKIPHCDTDIAILDGDSGEIIGTGIRSFIEFEEVDAERFVKIFLDGMKQAAGLTKTGLKILEFIHKELMENHNKDKVSLSWMYVKSKGLDIQKRTYDRGIHELLEKEFIFETLINETYFFNIRYMFNGDRIAFVKGYKLKQEKKRIRK